MIYKLKPKGNDTDPNDKVEIETLVDCLELYIRDGSEQPSAVAIAYLTSEEATELGNQLIKMAKEIPYD